jgi:Tol biopolymer transport system component
MPIANGTHIGHYEIVGWLGAGGMGEVYRAHDARLGREVAIKLILDACAGDPQRVHRFESEARAAGQLNHPNVIAVYDIGSHDGAPYIVSELLEGESLCARLRGGPLPSRKAVDYARQIALGLAAAHDRRIVHRDIKPDNVFVTSDDRIKILDFGLAKLAPGDHQTSRSEEAATQTKAGIVLGTAAYMSPEQVRGEAVDVRADLFAVGAILYEMLVGRPAFARATAADTMAAVLKEQPTLGDLSPALARIVGRCLEKAVEARFQSARDLAFALEVLPDTSSMQPPAVRTRVRARAALIPGVALALSMIAAATVTWWTERNAAPLENPLANARFTRLTDWEGTETLAEISPDGRFVAFLADREGQFDIWLTQVGTGVFRNLTSDMPAMSPPGAVLRNFGFNGDGSEIWFSASGRPGDRKMLMPLLGGQPRVFLGEGDVTPAWSPDGARLVFFNNKENGGDPVFVADRTGADAHQIVAPDRGVRHNHNPVWSRDSDWIYFLRGVDPTSQMNLWRVRTSGGAPEQLTDQHAPINYLAPLDARTILYVAPGDNRAGPWLWALDLVTKTTRRVSSGLEQYTTIASSTDGRRLVATIADPASSLWSVPLADTPPTEESIERVPVTHGRAEFPRLRGAAVFYISARGSEVGLWRLQDGQTSPLWKDATRPLSDPPAISHDGRRVAVVVNQGGSRRIAIMSADGTELRTLAPTLNIEGAPGASAVDWSPDGAWIVAGGTDAQGAGLFKIPVDGGPTLRLVAGHAVNPIWSPTGNMIVYATDFVDGQVPLRGIRPDGSRLNLPEVRTTEGGYRFLPDGNGLVYLPLIRSLDFWRLDFETGRTRPVTHLKDRGRLRSFDVSPDGRHIVFDRARENADIAVIDLPK